LGVVLRFGAYNRTLSPGINLTLPRPFETMMVVNVSNVRSLEDRGHMLTEDENLVEFNYKVQYRIAAAQNFLFEVRDPELTVKQAAESALRESVGTNSLDAILEGTQRELVRIETQRVLQETLDRYQAGIQVTQVNFTDVNVPAQVREAYSDVIRAREDRERFIEEARVHANSVVPEARGQAARVVQEAEGYKAATVALAEGEAQRFTLLLREYQKAPAITRKRLYLQTMENVFARSQKVLLDADSNGNVLYLPLDGLGGGSSARRALMPPIVTPDSGPVGENSATSRTSRREGRE
jgi:membrane protease subunit HflK